MNIFKNYKVWLVLAIIISVIAGICSVFLIRSYVGTVKVVSALTDIENGEAIQDKRMLLVDCAKGNLYPDTVYSPEDIKGMVAKGFIPAGTRLRKSMFSPAQTYGTSGKLLILGKDYRAVAIPNTMLTNVAGALRPGDKISLYATYKGAGKYIKLLSNCLVFQAGSVETNEGRKEASGLILALPEEKAETLIDYLPGGKKEATFVAFLQPVGGEAKELSTEEQKLAQQAAELEDKDGKIVNSPAVQQQIREEVQKQVQDQLSKQQQTAQQPAAIQQPKQPTANQQGKNQ